MHLDEGTLQALIDAELSSPLRKEAEAHLTRCAACAAEHDSLLAGAAVVTRALRTLEPVRPKVVPLRPRVTAGVRPAAQPRMRGTLARAAVLLLTFGAAASATVPGSPIRAWVGGLLDRGESTIVAAHQEADSGAPTTMAVAEVAESGVSVPLSNGRVVVIITGAPADLRVRAAVVDSERAGVFARGAAASARFRTAPGRLEVTDVGAGELRIELPRRALAATVEVNGRQYLALEGQQLRLSVPAEDSSATEVTFQVQQR